MSAIKVWAVDDDPALLFLVKLTLQSVDSTAVLTTFAHGGKAIEALKEHAHNANSLPDVILLDLNMPVMDGWDFLNTFATVATLQEKQIPVYILSSSINEKDMARAKTNKLVSAYISKPLEESALADLLNTVRKKAES